MKALTVSRLAWIAAALAVACGETPKPKSAPLDRLYRPTGLAVLREPGTTAGRLLVASSNGDLLYDDETGGSLIALDPSTDPVGLSGAIQARSFAGELAVADPEVCGTTVLPDPLALFATRGSNVLYAARIGAGGELSCDACDVALPGPFSDPFAIGIACGGGRRARAFVGYLGSFSGEAWITEYDLQERKVLGSMPVGAGAVGGFAYDRVRDRLFLLGLATAAPTPLRWLDLGGCTVGASGAGGCTVGQTFVPGFTTSLELRSMALARPSADPDAPRRAYLTGRLYDASAAATAGGRTDDLGGRLLVVDLVESARGEVDLRLVRELAIGRGAQEVRVLPQRPGSPPPRDLVAVLTTDEGTLTIYDDETGALVPFRRDSGTGIPALGHQPFGLAVDPELVGTVARLYVGSYGESYVTPVDVPLDAPEHARLLTGPDGTAVRISGGTP